MRRARRPHVGPLRAAPGAQAPREPRRAQPSPTSAPSARQGPSSRGQPRGFGASTEKPDGVFTAVGARAASCPGALKVLEGRVGAKCVCARARVGRPEKGVRCCLEEETQGRKLVPLPSLPSLPTPLPLPTQRLLSKVLTSAGRSRSRLCLLGPRSAAAGLLEGKVSEPFGTPRSASD